MRSHAQKYYFRAKREMDSVIRGHDFFQCLKTPAFKAYMSKALPIHMDYEVLGITEFVLLHYVTCSLQSMFEITSLFLLKKRSRRLLRYFRKQSSAKRRRLHSIDYSLLYLVYVVYHDAKLSDQCKLFIISPILWSLQIIPPSFMPFSSRALLRQFYHPPLSLLLHYQPSKVESSQSNLPFSSSILKKNEEKKGKEEEEDNDNDNDDDDDSSASLPLPVSLPVEQLMAPGGLFGPSSRTSAALSSTLSGSSSASLLPARFRSAPPLRLLPLTDFKSMAPRAKFSSSPLDASPSTSASAFNPSINPSTLNPSINPSAFNPSINPSNFSPSIRPPNQSPSMPPPTLNPSLPPPAPNPSIPSPNSNPSASQFNSSSNFNHSTTPSTDHFTLSSASNPPDSSIHPSNASFSSFSPSSSLLISSSAAAAAKSPSTGQFEPSLPLCIVTFDRTELLAYAKRFADPLRRCPVTNSCVVRFVPLRTPKAPDSENAFCVKREEIQLNGLPLAELIGMDGQTAGFLVPVTKKLSQVPSAVLLPEISNATNCIFYSVNIPLKTGEPT